MRFVVVCASFMLIALPSDAWAMHISEGILPFGWAALWYAASAPFVAAGLVKLRREATLSAGTKPLIGLIAAAVFVISCMPIPVPTAGSCSHPAATGMAAILIGPLYSILAASVALLLQALFMAHGGLSTWGANVLTMGIAGSLSGYAAYTLARRAGAPLAFAAFLAGLAGDWATYLATSAVLASALKSPGGFPGMFMAISAAFVPTQLPLGILEGFMTAGAVKFLHARRPELIGGLLGLGAGAARADGVKA